MKKIKNIVVPVDFSVTSRNAYRYARNLALLLEAQVTVINIKEPLIMTSDVVVAPYSNDNDDASEEIENFIIEEDKGLHINLSKNKVTAKYIKGNPLDVLVDLSEDGATDLIVMGSTGLEDFLEKIVGSVSHKVSNRAHCPVVLVPRSVRWHPITTIVYASNDDSINEQSLRRIAYFASDVSAEVHFVNVRNFDPLFEPKQKEVDWTKLSELNSSNINFDKHIIYGNDTSKELNTYCIEKNSNMLVLLSKHRNFWQSLVHKSVTEKIALSSTIPLMIIHRDDGDEKTSD